MVHEPSVDQAEAFLMRLMIDLSCEGGQMDNEVLQEAWAAGGSRRMEGVLLLFQKAREVT